jgi:tetratricopeptide (TPR) repeat protein
MLETIREYALDRLEESGELNDARRRHALAFCVMAEEAAAYRTDEEREEWLQRLDREYLNMRAALQWSFEEESGATAVRLASALAWFWDEKGYAREGRRWLERCLALGASSHMADTNPRAWAGILTGIAHLAAHQSDVATARTYAGEGVALWRQIGDVRGLAWGLRALGWVTEYDGDHARGRAVLQELVELSRREGTPRETSWAIRELAQAAMRQGDLPAARAELEQAVELCRQSADTDTYVFLLHQLGEVAWGQGHPSEVRALLDEGLTAVQVLREPAARFHALGFLARLAIRIGDLEVAETLLTEQHAVARDASTTPDAWWYRAWSLNHLGDLARCRDDRGRAAALYEESLELFREQGERQGIAAVLHNRGHLALIERDAHRARELFTESLRLFRELGFAWSMADSVTGLAGVLGLEGQSTQAAFLYGAAEAAHGAIDASGFMADPANRIAWDREIEIARAGADEEEWSRAWEAGRALSLDGAVALALGEEPVS